MYANYRMFKSYTKSWDTLFNEASNFANAMGRDRVINITHSCDQSEGVVVVWYWDSARQDQTYPPVKPG